MKKYQIVNLKTYPENNNDASSKKYVDDEDAKLLDLAGNRSMTGDLDMGRNSIVAIRDLMQVTRLCPKNTLMTKTQNIYR